MNKYIKKMTQSKASKRIISGLTAFVMLSGALPVNDMSNIGDFFSGFGYFSLLPLIASAADPSEADDPTFQHNPDTFEITVKNSEFADYSRSCQTYAKYHQQDKITITDLDDTSISDAINFAGLGTAAYPFAGTVASTSTFALPFSTPRICAATGLPFWSYACTLPGRPLTDTSSSTRSVASRPSAL